MSNALESIVKGLHEQHFGSGGDGNEMKLMEDLQKAMTDGGLWIAVKNILDAKKKQPMSKALSTQVLGAGYQDVGALRIEDLSNIMTRQVFDTETVPFFRRMHRVEAINIITSYNQLQALASYDGAFPFSAEGGLPTPNDSRYVRRTAQVRFAGTLRAITDPALRISTKGSGVANLRAAENENGMTFLLHQLEQVCLFQQANCSVVNGLQLGFDGIIPQFLTAAAGDPFIAQLDLDKHGTPLGPEDFRRAALRMKQIGKHSFPKDKNGMLANIAMLCDPYNADQVSNQMSPLQRFQAGEVIPGGFSNSVQTQFGRMPMVDDVWFSNYRRIGMTAPNVAAGPQPPNAPQAVALAVAPGPNSNWRASDASANIFYYVTSVGQGGESARVAAGPVAVAEGDVVTVSATNPAANMPMAYNLWRGTSADNCELVWQYPVIGAPGGVTAILDTNYWMPGTTPALAVCFDKDVLDLAELTPFFSMDLGRIDMSERWVIMTYLVPRLRNPFKLVLFRNCQSVLVE